MLGDVLPIAGVQAFRDDASYVHDGKIETGWGAFPQEPGQWLVIDLGSVREVGGLTHAIGEYFLDFPRLSSANITSGLPVQGPAGISPRAGAVGRRYWFHAATSSFMVFHGPPVTG